MDNPCGAPSYFAFPSERLADLLSILDDYSSLRAELTHAKEVAEGAGYRFEKAEAGRAEALAQLAKLRSTLTELHAIMKGECPGLLRESSGGMEIGLMIEAALKLGEGEK
jgi:hypothetical protein